MTYLLLKHIHVAAVVMSFAGFVWRGWLMLCESPRLHARWVRVVPHVVDTLLLASAVALAVLSRQYPLAQPWLTAKVVGLFIYIGLGTIALKRGPTRRTRIVAWLLALAVFGYIVSAALTRSPMGFLGMIGSGV
jgi:uncharacterized membrane protein SirB2